VAGARPDRSLVKRLKGLLDITSVTGSEPASRRPWGTSYASVGGRRRLLPARSAWIVPTTQPAAVLAPRQNRKGTKAIERVRACGSALRPRALERACRRRHLVRPGFGKRSTSESALTTESIDGRAPRLLFPGSWTRLTFGQSGSPLIAVTRSRSQPALPARPRSSSRSSGGEPLPALPALLAGPR
jgi:hypothetical protein